MSKTEKDLMDAFAGDLRRTEGIWPMARGLKMNSCTAWQSFSAPSPKPKPSMLIKHLRTAAKVKSTKENLEDAIAGRRTNSRKCIRK